ncbi:unnamed protein product [Rodentolepis nana]|uniref:Glycerophosphocholine acyltransferase 1 n=1 Tax=Rodentolepis nana TaxID=102285 RepID=A0A0R3T288_RODNA|nr:unnamed protein product [Rodentolepis nana]
MLGPCYFVNIYALIFIWAFPHSLEVFYVLFGLANSTVYSAIVLFRNSFVFHNYDKMTSCFIHILPPLISYCVRWFPQRCSKEWYTNFVDSQGDTGITKFNPMGSWIYLLLLPNAFFLAHTLIYFVVVHVIIKPDETYNDNYRYLRTKYFAKMPYFKKMSKTLQSLIWVFLNILTNFALSLISILAWCTFFFHSFMMILMVIVMSWYGGSYYLDYFAYLALRKAIQNNEVPSPKADDDVGNPTEMENYEDEDTAVSESLRHNLEIALEDEGSDSDSDIV